jgi:hypothetical protein
MTAFPSLPMTSAVAAPAPSSAGILFSAGANPEPIGNSDPSSGMFDAVVAVEWCLASPGDPTSFAREGSSAVSRLCMLGGVVDGITSPGYAVHLEPFDVLGNSSLGVNCQLRMGLDEEHPEVLLRKPQTVRLAWGAVQGERIVKAVRQSLAVITGPAAGVRLSRSSERWHSVRQELTLNRPGHADGILRVWLDGYPVLDTGASLNLRGSEDIMIVHAALRLFPAGSATTLKKAPLSRIADISAVRSYLPRGASDVVKPVVADGRVRAAHEPTSFLVAVGLVRLDSHGV